MTQRAERISYVLRPYSTGILRFSVRALSTKLASKPSLSNFYSRRTKPICIVIAFNEAHLNDGP